MFTGRWFGMSVALAVLLVCAAGPLTGRAQDAAVIEQQLAPDQIEALIGAARQGTLRISVVDARLPDGPPPPAGASIGDAVDAAEARIAAIGRSAAADLEALPSRIRTHWPAEGWAGFGAAVLLALAACGGGWLVEMAARTLLRRRATASAGMPAGEAARYRSVLRFVSADLLAILLQIAVATVLFLALTRSGSPDRHVGYAIILVGCVTLRLGLALLTLLTLLARDDARASAAATGVRGAGLALAVVLAVAVSFIAMLARLELGAALIDVVRLTVATGFVALLGGALWFRRREITAIVFHDSSSLAARVWPLAALAYLAVAICIFAVKVVTGAPVNGMAILAPIFCGAIAFVVHALCMSVLLRPARRVAGPAVGFASIPETIAGAETKTGTNPSQAAAIAGAVALAAWAGGIALAWNVPFWSEASGRLHGVWAVLLILLMARIAWVSIRAFFDRRIAAEGPGVTAGEPGDEGGGKGSRLGTILPLCRSFLLITVSVIAGMIVLSQLGLDVAPLFAGAGLVGVAVGFGAQSLVRDIFSGLFFLLDDAFRVGEYIETGGLRGTVERISIRSMQLRHQNGPLHTIAFGEIAQLTNYSRDWVIMKLALHVTFDTDPERVRKLIKKLGQELIADPLIGDKFVEPLKSQGVRDIDDLGQIVRVKFMTRPGEQFVLRRIVYARMRELFEREGIEFARREVRVRVTSQGAPLTEAETQEIAGAAAEGAI